MTAPTPRTSPGQHAVDAAIAGLALAVMAAGRLADAARAVGDAVAAGAWLARRR